MKANELRIGNWIHDTGEDGGIAKVDQIGKLFKDGRMCVSFYGEKGGYTTTSLEEDYDGDEEDKMIQPIPLTEEWLIKFGFRVVSDKMLYLPIPKISSEIHYEKESYGNVIVLYGSTGSFIPDDIDYVHQLQNLYFALTGEELTIKQ